MVFLDKAQGAQITDPRLRSTSVRKNLLDAVCSALDLGGKCDALVKNGARATALRAANLPPKKPGEAEGTPLSAPGDQANLDPKEVASFTGSLAGNNVDVDW